MGTPTVKRKSLRDNFKTGHQFEKYIASLFNERKFTIKTWRKSQKLNDISKLIEYGEPDLQMIYIGKKNYRFAVECKWRSRFIDGKITWAEEKQIRKYRKFERTYRIHVFVAIGIGGTASQPEKLFLTPLQNMGISTEVSESDLIPYKRNTTRRFFFDTVQLKLF
jgi:hypothetical protein